MEITITLFNADDAIPLPLWEGKRSQTVMARYENTWIKAHYNYRGLIWINEEIAPSLDNRIVGVTKWFYLPDLV